jgi:hypothetical protein
MVVVDDAVGGFFQKREGVLGSGDQPQQVEELCPGDGIIAFDHDPLEDGVLGDETGDGKKKAKQRMKSSTLPG